MPDYGVNPTGKHEGPVFFVPLFVDVPVISNDETKEHRFLEIDFSCRKRDVIFPCILKGSLV